MNNNLNKCRNCGSSDVHFDIKTGKLSCNHCKSIYDTKINHVDSSLLTETVIGEGTLDIIDDDITSFKCMSCGSAISINTNEELVTKCPWCRNTLTVDMKVKNGAVPDMILPFKISKEEAISDIKEFINKNKSYTSENFLKSFDEENIVGIYLPYLVVDINAKARLYGQGEKTASMRVKKDDIVYYTEYDADLFYVKREFDLLIDDIVIETNIDNLNIHDNFSTNNIINAIMPFDIENCVKWNANYVKGYSFEKRDINITDMKKLVNSKITNIIKNKVNETVKQYDRGVNWKEKFLDYNGEQWLSAYLPVWLYSFKDINDKTHFIALNGRTKELVGSLPFEPTKLVLESIVIIIIGAAVDLFFNLNYIVIFVFLFIALIHFTTNKGKYNKQNIRHEYEKETMASIENLVKEDSLIKRRYDLTKKRMSGANNDTVSGDEFIIKELINKDKVK